MNEEKIKENDNIATNTIIEDIEDTQREIKDMEDEKEVLERNPQDNKVRIYMLKGGILRRKQFIDDLDEILDYRIKHNYKDNITD